MHAIKFAKDNWERLKAELALWNVWSADSTHPQGASFGVFLAFAESNHWVPRQAYVALTLFGLELLTLIPLALLFGNSRSLIIAWDLGVQLCTLLIFEIVIWRKSILLSAAGFALLLVWLFLTLSYLGVG